MDAPPVDESLLILSFVVLPTLLLLLRGIFLGYRSERRRSHVSLPNFSLDISRLSRSEFYVTYRNADFKLHLFAQESIDREKRKHLYVEIPGSLSEDKLGDVWHNLQKGLAKLGSPVPPRGCRTNRLRTESRHNGLPHPIRLTNPRLPVTFSG